MKGIKDVKITVTDGKVLANIVAILNNAEIVEPGKTGKPINSVLCQKCSKDIFKISKTPKKTIEYSLKFHGGFYCYNCQQILKEEKAGGSA